MNTIQFACDHCKKALKVPAEKAGTKGRCPGCKQPLIVPAAPEPDNHKRVEEAAGQVERTARTVSKVAKATGKVADAVGDLAEAGDKVGKAATAVAGLAAGGSTLVGGIGDFLRPLGPINLIVFVVALACAGVLFVVARRKGVKVKVRVRLGTVASVAVALIFGLWTGLGAVAGQGDKGVLATNIPAVERAQVAVLPAKEPPPVVAEPKEEPVGEMRRFSVPSATWGWTAFSPDGRRVLYCGLSPATPNSPTNQNWLIEWDWEASKELRRVALPDERLHEVSFSPDRKLLLLGGISPSTPTVVWDVEAGREVRRLDQAGMSFTRAAFCPDGRHAVLGGGDALVLVEAATGKLVRRFEGADVKDCHRLAVSPDGKLLYTLGTGLVSRVWDVGSGRFLREVTRGQKGFARPAFTSDSLLVLDGGKGDVRLWDVRTGKAAASFDGLDQYHCAAFSSDGRLLLTGHQEQGAVGDLRVWDVAGRREVVRLKGHSMRGGEGTDISPDGRHAVSSSQDGTVRVWRLPKVENKAGGPPVPVGQAGDGWLPLCDTREQMKRHWQKGSGHGSFVYDDEARTIRIEGIQNAGAFTFDGHWREFEVEVEVPKLDARNFGVTINKNGFKVGEALAKHKGPVLLTARYSPEKELLTVTLGGEKVGEATVTGTDWGKTLRCEWYVSGGSVRAEVLLRKARVLPAR